MPPSNALPLTKLSSLVYLTLEKQRELENQANRITLQQLPGNVFGDGSHPTTRLCAGAVDVLCRLNRPRFFLDVGTGTGVLARIARARGVESVFATDIDVDALESARAHAALDSSSAEIQISSHAPDHWGSRFNLVVANILEGPLRSLAPQLSSALAPSGTLLISGFTSLQAPSLQVSFANSGLVHVSESNLDEWSLLMFTKLLAR